ncbi:hypothetical protein SeLEV6574_g08616, partial [Synchytrium endobioticum]
MNGNEKRRRGDDEYADEDYRPVKPRMFHISHSPTPASIWKSNASKVSDNAPYTGLHAYPSSFVNPGALSSPTDDHLAELLDWRLKADAFIDRLVMEVTELKREQTFLEHQYDAHTRCYADTIAELRKGIDTLGKMKESVDNSAPTDKVSATRGTTPATCGLATPVSDIDSSGNNSIQKCRVDPLETGRLFGISIVSQPRPALTNVQLATTTTQKSLSNSSARSKAALGPSTSTDSPLVDLANAESEVPSLESHAIDVSIVPEQVNAHDDRNTSEMQPGANHAGKNGRQGSPDPIVKQEPEYVIPQITPQAATKDAPAPLPLPSQTSASQESGNEGSPKSNASPDTPHLSDASIAKIMDVLEKVICEEDFYLDY